jgi:hypothetical protein
VKNCIQCDKRLFGTVAFCPFCGTTTGDLPEELVASDAVASVLEAARPDVASSASSRPDVAQAKPPQPSVPARAPMQPEAPPPRKSAEAPPATPVRKAKPEAAKAVDPSPAAEQGRARKPRKLLRNIVLGAFAVVVVLALIGRGANKQEMACNQQVDAGTKLVQSGDLTGAAAQSKLASASCTGNLEARAIELQTLVSTAEATRTQCAHAYDAVTSRLRDGRLSAAVSGLNQLPLACAGTQDANQIREQVEQASTAADTAEQQVRTAIAAGDTVSAKAAVDELARLDRFRQVLPSLRAQIAAIPASAPAVTTTEQTTAPATAAQPPVVQAPVMQAPVPQPVRAAAAPPAANGDAGAAQQFLGDAQTALAQGRFDAAKTYLDSARRLDPANPRIDALARVVRDRERQVLEDETTIK